LLKEKHAAKPAEYSNDAPNVLYRRILHDHHQAEKTAA